MKFSKLLQCLLAPFFMFAVDDDGGGFSLEGLSPEERAAIVGDADDEQSALDAVIAEGKQALKVVVDDDDEEDDAATTQAAAAITPAATTAEREAEMGDFAPVFVAPAVENYQEKMAALNADKAAALKAMIEGELSPEDYALKEQQYLNDRDELRAAQDRAVTAEQMRTQTAEQRWQWEVDKFKGDARKEGVDYNKDLKLNSALDRWVKVLANDPENAAQPGEWFLQEAHKNVRQQYGLAPAKSTPQNKTREPDLRNIPPTLGRVPAAADGDAGSNEFAHMDKLDGLALERAMAKMTPDQQERYLAATN